MTALVRISTPIETNRDLSVCFNENLICRAVMLSSLMNAMETIPPAGSLKDGSPFLSVGACLATGNRISRNSCDRISKPLFLFHSCARFAWYISYRSKTTRNETQNMHTINPNFAVLSFYICFAVKSGVDLPLSMAQQNYIVDSRAN